MCAIPDFGKSLFCKQMHLIMVLGQVLSQVNALGNEKAVAYASKALSPREQKYLTTEKELFAVVFGTAHFCVYLLGQYFQLITDHSALCWLHTMEAYRSLSFQSSAVLAQFIMLMLLSCLVQTNLNNTPCALRICSNQDLPPQCV